MKATVVETIPESQVSLRGKMGLRFNFKAESDLIFSPMVEFEYASKSDFRIDEREGAPPTAIALLKYHYDSKAAFVGSAQRK